MAVNFDAINTIFNTELNENLRPGGYFPENSFKARPFAPGTFELNLPINITRTSGNYTDVADLLSYPTETIQNVKLSLDEPIKEITAIGKSDIENQGLSIVRDYAMGLKMDLMEAEAHRMSAILAKTALDNGNYIVVDNTKGGSETYEQYWQRMQHAVDIALKNLRKNHVRGPFVGMLHPDLYTPAAKSEWAASADYTQNAMTGFSQRRMTLSNAVIYEEISVCDFDWSNGGTDTPTNLPTKYQEDFQDHGLLGFVWAPNIFNVGRAASIEIDQDYEIKNSAFEYVARSRIGTALTHNEGVYAIVSATGSHSSEDVDI